MNDEGTGPYVGDQGSIAGRIDTLKNMIRGWGNEYLDQIKTYTERQEQLNTDINDLSTYKIELEQKMTVLGKQKTEVDGLVPGIDALAAYDKSLAELVLDGSKEAGKIILEKEGDFAAVQDLIEKEGIAAEGYAKGRERKEEAKAYASSLLEDIASENKDAARKREHNALVTEAYGVLKRIYATVLEKTVHALAEEVFKRVDFDADGSGQSSDPYSPSDGPDEGGDPVLDVPPQEPDDGKDGREDFPNGSNGSSGGITGLDEDTRVIHERWADATGNPPPGGASPKRRLFTYHRYD